MKFPNSQRPWPKFSHFQAWTKVPHHCLFVFLVCFLRPYEPCVQAAQYSGTPPDYPSFKNHQDLKCWGAWDTTSGTKPRTPHTTDHLEEKGMEKGSTQWSSLKGWEVIINSTNIGKKTKAILGKVLRDRVEYIGLFQAHQYHLELNWSKTTFPHALSILILWKRYEPHTKDWPPLSADFHCGLSSGFLLCCCNHFYIKVLHRYWLSQTSNLCLLKHFDISVVL